MADRGVFRFDGGVNTATVVAIVAACIALAGSVATTQAAVAGMKERVDAHERRFGELPERMAAIEAYQKTQTKTLERIEQKLDVVIPD